MGQPENEYDNGPLRPPPPAPARWGLSRVLRLATGVREDILAFVPGERAQYTSMGGVVVGTAIMAMLSMAAALYWVFGGFELFIPLAVPVWGLFIISLDRWLMSSTSMGQVGRAWRKLLPRLGLSIALGVILAEPLLLGVYNTAINERVAKDRQQEITTRESNLRICNPVPGTPEASQPAAHDPKCQGFKLSLGGDSPDALQSKLDDLTTQRDALNTTVGDDAKKYAELEQLARMECNGTPGQGLTGKFGAGINCKRLRNEADQYRADHKIDENGQKLSDLNGQITDVQTKLGDARNNYATLVNAKIQADLDEVRARQGRVGLLERFRTLDELVSENGYVRITQWAIRIFFIIVDALPVILKVLNGHTTYDRLLEKRLSQQERVQNMRSDEEIDRSAQWSDVVRHEHDLQRRMEFERIDETDRIERANYDERRNELIDALENHLMRTAIGPASPGWEPAGREHRVVDLDAEAPTQEFTRPNASGGYE